MELALARNFGSSMDDNSNCKWNLVVVPSLKLAMCITNEAVPEAVFDKAMKLSAATGVFVCSTPQLLTRLKVLKAIPEQAMSVTLSTMSGVRVGIRCMKLDKALAASFMPLERSRMPGLMYAHPLGQALSAAAAAAAAGAYGEMAEVADRAGDTVVYSEDILYWPMYSPMPQRLPPPFTEAQLDSL